MRKRRRASLTPEEEAAIAADLALRKTLTTKMLMRKYNCSRSVIDKVGKGKTHLVPHETNTQNAFNGRHKLMTATEIEALAMEHM